MLFNVVGYFKPGGAARTRETAESFVDHLEQPLMQIPLAGALRDAKGDEIGFMLLIEAKSFAAAEKFIRESPQRDLYDRIDVTALDVEVGRLN